MPASRRPCPLVGFPLRHAAGRAELRRFRRNPAPRWRNACLGNVGRARATRWCFSGFVSVPLKALCGGPRADSSQIRRHVGGTRVWATWAGRALLLCVLFLGLFPCSLAGLVRRALRRFRSDPAPRWRNASWANVGLARASRSAFRACFPCPRGAGVRQCRDSCDIRCHVGGTRDRAARSTKEGGPKEPEKKGRREARGKAWGGCFPEVFRDSGRHGRRASLARIVCSALPESGIR